MDPSMILLAGGEIHGFGTLADLDITKLQDDALTRWFRPNEVYAILTNSIYFTVQPQPVEYPINGSIVLFDRKVLRNFRKDGYKWKKKKDGKTVQEAHEKLKIGNEERIHVYYARGEDDPNFYRRCYWLLDKKLEHVVLVHYRQIVEQDNATQSLFAPVECKEPSHMGTKMYDSSPLTPLNSVCGSVQSDLSGSAVMSEEINSNENQDIFTGSGIFLSKKHIGLQSNELTLHDINNLGWEELALASEYIESSSGRKDDALVSCDGLHEGGTEYFGISDDQAIPSVQQVTYSKNGVDDSFFNGRNGFEHWDDLNDDFISLLNAPLNLKGCATMGGHSSVHQQIFIINEVSPEWGYSKEETKVVVIGKFSESHKHLITSRIYCVFGDLCVETQMIQPGVYKCTVLLQIPGKVDLFLTLDGHAPISQVIAFYSRPVAVAHFDNGVTSDDMNAKFKSNEMKMQKRLAYLLFSTDFVSLFSRKLQPKSIKEAKKFALLTSPYIENGWKELLSIDCQNEIPSYQDCEDFLELLLKNKLQEWLVEKIADGCKATARDRHGQGAIHLCTILDYSWAVSLFSLSGFSLDFRDAYGWTALHWAAYLGREKMVASLLSAGADPSLVTDPTPEIPGGLTAADLASKGGHEGLAAYLAEKGLTAHFEAMSLVGNIPSSISCFSKNQTSSKDQFSDVVLSEQEMCLKESLAAYRNAADAADRIQAAFRERTLKLLTEAVQQAKPEMEASQIIAALRIQHAYRNHSRRRLMKAAARIQSHFRTWRTRRDFLSMRLRAIKIQAAFRGHQVRKQHQKIIWSVGVLEKAILRWRMKRRGLRGIQVESMEACTEHNSEESASAMEEFFKNCTKHAEERVRRSVIRVQSMFRSYRAQQEYRRMKQAHEEAKLKFSLNGVAGFH